MYVLSMEAFKYNGELLQTGVDEIDRIANKQAPVYNHVVSVGGTGTYEQYEWVYQGASLETALNASCRLKRCFPIRILENRRGTGWTRRLYIP
jgi:hypothetical protein